jgi:hypothetical protein
MAAEDSAPLETLLAQWREVATDVADVAYVRERIRAGETPIPLDEAV